MYIEGFSKLSQAQEIRSAAFHMAMQTASRAYDHKVTKEEVISEAEAIEEWLWKANEERGLAALIQSSQALVDLLAEPRTYAIGAGELEGAEEMVREALKAVSIGSTKRKRK